MFTGTFKLSESQRSPSIEIHLDAVKIRLLQQCEKLHVYLPNPAKLRVHY